MSMTCALNRWGAQVLERLAPVGLLLLLGAAPWAARADHPCTNSPGEVRIGTWPGSNGVAPIPICRWVQQPGQGAAPARAAPVVIDRWEWTERSYNALALGEELGAYGMSSGERSQLAADRKALALCREAGGGSSCEIVAGSKNGCLTLVAENWGKGGRIVFDSNPVGAANRNNIERGALGYCQQQALPGQACRVVQTVCEEVKSLGMRAGPRQPGVNYGPPQR
jgi:Domain of unknown function (DUF4189)